VLGKEGIEMTMVKVVTDTTSGLPLDTLKELGVSVLPQIIIFGEESYRDDSELDTQTFLQKLKASPELPKTSAPPPNLFAPVFERLTAGGNTVVAIHPSDELSGTVKFAVVATQ
jgi:DegV family protein with EDD domain